MRLCAFKLNLVNEAIVALTLCNVQQIVTLRSSLPGGVTGVSQ